MANTTRGPVPGAHYPADLAQLRAWFPTDADCLDYLDWIRWPNGFICPDCAASASGVDAAGRYRCRGCRKQVSVISGTIFHLTRTPLTVWFEAVWHFTTPKSGVNAAHLHRVLPIHSYQTAWTMLSKLRQVMDQTERSPLVGRVEVDETFLGGPRPGIRGRGALGKVLVAGAVEITTGGWGRTRVQVIEDTKTATLKEFVRATISAGAEVVTDGLGSYPPALEGYEHEPINISATGRPAHQSLPAVHRMFSLAKRMIEGTYQGAGTPEHVQEYLDEFVFRFNRRNSHHRGLLFLRLLQASVSGEPVPYRQLVKVPKQKPVSPPGVTGPRQRPGTLAVPPQLRPWRDAPSDLLW